MVGMSDDDKQRFLLSRNQAAHAQANKRHDLLVSYLVAYSDMCGRPADEVELREFQKNAFEVSYRFVVKDTTDQQTIEALRRILSQRAVPERMLEQVAALIGIENYD